MAEQLASLNDEDLVKIGQVSHQIQAKYGRRQWSSRGSLLRLMDEIEKEAVDRFLKIGFVVQVDTSPMLAGYPPTISIAERFGSIFDPEKKSWEVKKANTRNESILHEDKNPTGKTVTGE